MRTLPSEAEVITKMAALANAHPAIRVLLLTSSRARPGGAVDALSDYDFILAVTGAFCVGWEADWLYYYGEPMVRWGDEGNVLGITTHFRSVIYQDYVKMDFTIWPESLLSGVAASPALPEELDAGYKVVLDKDGATAEWKLPAYNAYIPVRPTQAEYQALVEEFWWVATYVAKGLWRDEVVFARWVLTADLRDGALRRMLEWRIEIDHGWSVRPGVHGRGLKTLLPTSIWSDLADTYTGAGIENDWTALWRTTALFRRIAREVAGDFGYIYPQNVDDRVSAFLGEVESMPKS